jgi:hypothetical protein
VSAGPRDAAPPHPESCAAPHLLVELCTSLLDQPLGNLRVTAVARDVEGGELVGAAFRLPWVQPVRVAALALPPAQRDPRRRGGELSRRGAACTAEARGGGMPGSWSSVWGVSRFDSVQVTVLRRLPQLLVQISLRLTLRSRHGTTQENETTDETHLHGVREPPGRPQGTVSIKTHVASWIRSNRENMRVT